jgi:hypothetical protein
VKTKRKRRLSQSDLRVLGATPGLMAHRVGPDGRARLEQLAPEGLERRRDFVQKLTDGTKGSEWSEIA